MQTQAGSFNYAAPQVHGNIAAGDDGESSAYTNAVDVWSFGCVIYQILALKVRFPTYPQDSKHFCTGGEFPEGPLSARAITEGGEFVKTILRPSAKSRPPVASPVKAPWLLINDILKDVKIIGHDGREIDPSNHIPESNYAPLLESKGPKYASQQPNRNSASTKWKAGKSFIEAKKRRPACRREAVHPPDEIPPQ
jgi:serine/threonine protein kinase